MLAVLSMTATLIAATLPSAPAGTAFYTPPSLLPAGKHGDVIWSRPFATSAALPSASRNVLVLYRTTGADGKDRAVSGAVAIPPGIAPRGGWPVISWAHGTTGDAPACTPTLDGPDGPVHDYLGPIDPVLDKLVAAGYAVLQTDYEGQGTPGIHPYLIGVAEAHDTIDMVRAARQIEPRLSTRWLAMGHSQGGHAALFAGTAASGWAPELQLVGVVAEAPGAYISPFIASMPKTAAPTPAFAFAALFMQAAASVDPEVKLDQILTPAAVALLPQLLDRCTGGLYRPDSWGGLVPAAAFRSDAPMQALLRDAAANDAAPLHLGVPVLILQGTTDTTVPKASSDALDKALCANGATVRYEVYQGLGHRPVVPASVDDALSWIGARFAGNAAPSNCGADPVSHG
jgi:alpha-beta hydrolase superfamily lysophospholipase